MVTFTVKTVLHVVDEVEEPGAQVTVADAQKIQVGAQLGDVLETGFIHHKPGAHSGPDGQAGRHAAPAGGRTRTSFSMSTWTRPASC